jgi:enamine deaminase RidA (YjgF/YER057c/UK114 family)
MPRTALEPDDYPFLDYRRFTFSLAVMAGGSAWLSGSTAVRHDAGRGMFVEGDLVAQARLVLDKMRATLVPAGLSLVDMVRVVEYVTPAALPDLPKLVALRREAYGGASPSVSTIVVKSLLRPTALIEIEGVARRGGPGDVSYSTTHEPEVTLGAPRSGERAITFLSTRMAAPAQGLGIVMPCMAEPGARAQFETAAGRGVAFLAAEGDPAAGDVVGQCREVYARIARHIEAMGANLDAVVKTTEFVTPAGLAAYRSTADVRRDVFATPYPAATGVICEALPTPGALIAVEAVVVTAA